MRFFVTTCAVLFSVLSLSACSKLGLNGHANDYVKGSHQVAPVVVPPQVSAIKKDTYYVVPTVAVSHAEHVISTVPPTLIDK